jgi:hypothetical protein
MIISSEMNLKSIGKSGLQMDSNWLFFRINHVSFLKNRVSFQPGIVFFDDFHIGEISSGDYGNLGELGRAIRCPARQE